MLNALWLISFLPSPTIRFNQLNEYCMEWRFCVVHISNHIRVGFSLGIHEFDVIRWIAEPLNVCVEMNLNTRPLQNNKILISVNCSRFLLFRRETGGHTIRTYAACRVKTHKQSAVKFCHTSYKFDLHTRKHFTHSRSCQMMTTNSEEDQLLFLFPR